MRNLLIVFFTIILFLLIIVLPIKTRFMAHFNLLAMKGFYSIKVLFFRILCGKIYIEGGKVKVSNLADAISGSYTSPFMQAFAKKLLSKLDIKKMEIFFTGGFAENSFSSAMVCGSVSSMVRTLYSVLSQRYENVKLYENVSTTFGENNLELTFDIVITLSIFQIISSAVSAIFAKKGV